MKRVLVIAISMIATLGISSPLFAQERVTINSQEARNVVEINPYNLVTGSYQGRFVDQGIPSGGRFLAAGRTAGDPTAIRLDARRAGPRISDQCLRTARCCPSRRAVAGAVG